MQSFVIRGRAHRLITICAASVSSLALISAAQAASTSEEVMSQNFSMDTAQALSPSLNAYTPVNQGGFFLNQQPSTVVPAAGDVAQFPLITGQGAPFAPVQAQLQQVQPQIQQQFVQQPLPQAAFQTTIPAPQLVQQPVVQQQALPQQITVPQGQAFSQQIVTGYPQPQLLPQPYPQPTPYQDPCPQSGMVYPAAQALVGGAGLQVYSTRDGRGVFFEVPSSHVVGGVQSGAQLAAGLAQIVNGEQALYVQLIAHADKRSGRSDRVNLDYTQGLANYMASLIASNGVNPSFVQATGFGHRLRSSIGGDDRIEVRLIPAQNCPGFNQAAAGPSTGGTGYSYSSVGYGPGAGFASPATTNTSVQVQAPAGAAVQVNRAPSVNGPIDAGAIVTQAVGGQPVATYSYQSGPQLIGQPVQTQGQVYQVSAPVQGGFDPYAVVSSAPVQFQSAGPQVVQQFAPQQLAPQQFAPQQLAPQQFTPAPGFVPAPANGFPISAPVFQ